MSFQVSGNLVIGDPLSSDKAVIVYDVGSQALQVSQNGGPMVKMVNSRLQDMNEGISGTPGNGDIIQYDTGSGQWENKNLGLLNGAVDTTNLTPAQAILFPVLDKTLVTAKVIVSGIRTDGARVAGYELFGVFQGTTGAASQIGGTITQYSTNESDPAQLPVVTFSTSGVGNNAFVQVIGQDTFTWNWTARANINVAQYV